jgi:hypothetical protein
MHLSNGYRLTMPYLIRVFMDLMNREVKEIFYGQPLDGRRLPPYFLTLYSAAASTLRFF